MRRRKGSSPGNFFLLPNEIFDLGLNPNELAVYSFLVRCADRSTRQCWPRLQTIADATGMSKNTAGKYVDSLAEKGLIATERTTVAAGPGIVRNGSLLFTVRPFHEVLNETYRHRLAALEAEDERRTAQAKLAETALP